MGARQFQAKWPDLPQRKQDSLGPNSTFSLEAGITTRLDMGNSVKNCTAAGGKLRAVSEV